MNARVFFLFILPSIGSFKSFGKFSTIYHVDSEVDNSAELELNMKLSSCLIIEINLTSSLFLTTSEI